MNPRENLKKNFDPQIFLDLEKFIILQRCTLPIARCKMQIAILVYTSQNYKFNGASLSKSLKCEGAPSGFMGDDIPPDKRYYPANIIYLSYIPHKHKEYITPPGNSQITHN